MIIYSATNKLNGKMYIGQTIHTLKKRKQEHYYEAKGNRYDNHFYKALRKYNPKDFKWKIIHECADREELNRLEIYYICYYRVIEKGYNHLIGGGSAIGFKHSEESKLKMSEFQKGIKCSEEAKRKISESAKARYVDIRNHPAYGRKLTEETKKKMSEAHKGIIFTEEQIKNMSKAQKGRVFTEEHKAKISKAKKGVPKTEETKRRMRASYTKERRLARSIRVKKYWEKKKQGKQDNAV